MAQHDGMTFTSFLTRADFENLKHDPMLVLERATQFISFLEQQQNALSEENRQLQQLRTTSEKVSFTAEQHARLIEHAAELELDHRELSQKFIDLEVANKNLQGIADALRSDKQHLQQEVNVLRNEQAELVLRDGQIMGRIQEWEDQRTTKEERLRVQQNEIERKIAELEDASQKVIVSMQHTTEIQDSTEKIGSGRLALEAETVVLEQTTQQQERTLQYLQNEVTYLDNMIKDKADEIVQLKKSMSGAILELQLQITKAEEEMSRLRTSVANEKDLTGRQNLWLAKDLQVKTQELLINRQELAKENSTLKTDLTLLREKAARLKSNVYVAERRSQVLQDDLRRLEDEDASNKRAYAERKEATHVEMNNQAAVVAKLHGELQTAREDLYILKQRMCKICANILLGKN